MVGGVVCSSDIVLKYSWVNTHTSFTLSKTLEKPSDSVPWLDGTWPWFSALSLYVCVTGSQSWDPGGLFGCVGLDLIGRHGNNQRWDHLCDHELKHQWNTRTWMFVCLLVVIMIRLMGVSVEICQHKNSRARPTWLMKQWQTCCVSENNTDGNWRTGTKGSWDIANELNI